MKGTFELTAVASSRREVVLTCGNQGVCNLMPWDVWLTLKHQ